MASLLIFGIIFQCCNYRIYRLKGFKQSNKERPVCSTVPPVPEIRKLKNFRLRSFPVILDQRKTKALTFRVKTFMIHEKKFCGFAKKTLPPCKWKASRAAVPFPYLGLLRLSIENDEKTGKIQNNMLIY